MYSEATLLFFIFIASIQAILFEPLQIEAPKDPLVLVEGDDLTVLCSIKHPVQNCTWHLVDSDNQTVIDLVVKPGEKLPERIKYHGRGLETGECGITILYVTDKHNGVLKCGVFPRSDINIFGIYKNTTIIVAKAPRAPQINVTRLYQVNNEYPENAFVADKQIRAECKVEFGRPVAKISWFIGKKPIKRVRNSSIIEDVGPKGGGWQTIRQSITMNLVHSHNGKDLRCVADHIAFGQGFLSHRNYTLNVYFSPRLKYKNTGNCVFVDGQTAKISVEIMANPKPVITWTIDGEELLKGEEYTRFKASKLSKRGRSKWDAVLTVLEVLHLDYQKKLYIIAENMLGKQDIRIEMSTCRYEKSSSS